MFEMMREAYDANHDAFPVTYWDMQMAQQIENLLSMVFKLEERLAKLEDQATQEMSPAEFIALRSSLPGTR